MIAVHAQDVTYEHVGRTDQAGWQILYVHDLPLHWHGVSITVSHPDTGAEQVWDLTGTDTLWLREEDPEPERVTVYHIPRVGFFASTPSRWRVIAEDVAHEVTSS